MEETSQYDVMHKSATGNYNKDGSAIFLPAVSTSPII